MFWSVSTYNEIGIVSTSPKSTSACTNRKSHKMEMEIYIFIIFNFEKEWNFLGERILWINWFETEKKTRRKGKIKTEETTLFFNLTSWCRYIYLGRLGFPKIHYFLWVTNRTWHIHREDSPVLRCSVSSKQILYHDLLTAKMLSICCAVKIKNENVFPLL